MKKKPMLKQSKKKVYIGWIEKTLANKPFYWCDIDGDDELVTNGEGIFRFKSRSENLIEEIKIKITVEILPFNVANRVDK